MFVLIDLMLLERIPLAEIARVLPRSESSLRHIMWIFESALQTQKIENHIGAIGYFIGDYNRHIRAAIEENKKSSKFSLSFT